MRRFNLFFFAMSFAMIAYGQSPVHLQPYRGPSRDFLMATSTKSLALDYELKKMNNSSLLDSFFVAFISTYHIPGIAACIVKNDSIVWQVYVWSGHPFLGPLQEMEGI
jgi:CubicO group peptidase (beta-lactamase class C family)